MSRLDELYRMRAFIAHEIAREEALEVAVDHRAATRSEQALGAAADLYDVSVEEILSASRDRRVVKARQATCWLLRARGVSLKRIGAIVGRDHTTVMHAIERIDGDPAMRGLLWPLLQQVAA